MLKERFCLLDDPYQVELLPPQSMNMTGFLFHHEGYGVRHWTAADRDAAAGVVKQCLEAYGLNFEPQGADLDAVEVEEHYLKDRRGEFWVVEEEGTGIVVGTAGYYEVEEKGDEKSSCVEIRKMYLLPRARGKKLGRLLLQVCTNMHDM